MMKRKAEGKLTAWSDVDSALARLCRLDHDRQQALSQMNAELAAVKLRFGDALEDLATDDALLRAALEQFARGQTAPAPRAAGRRRSPGPPARRRTAASRRRVPRSSARAPAAGRGPAGRAARVRCPRPTTPSTSLRPFVSSSEVLSECL